MPTAGNDVRHWQNIYFRRWILDYDALKEPVENMADRLKHHPNKKFEKIFESNLVDIEYM